MTAEQPGRVTQLSARGISKHFGKTRALDDIDLDIANNEFFTIVGPSGSGKSTLIRILAGLEQPGSGTVELSGANITDVPANKRPTCMVFQSLALFTHRSVGENIEFAAKMRGDGRAERRALAMKVMETVRLPPDFYDRPVTQCSGGEQQRVALARALASDPEILFFDEPLSAIDFRLRKILEVQMKELHRRSGKTFIYITHSLEEAMVMSDRIAIMRDGRIVQTGTPQQIYAQPSSRFVAEFMGEVNIFTVSDDRIVDLRLTVDGIGNGFLVVRPEHVRRAAADRPPDVSFAATVVDACMLGSRSQFHLAAGDTRLVAELPASRVAGLAPGDQNRWGFDLDDAVVVSE